MVERTAPPKSHYVPPTVESMVESDDDTQKRRSSREGLASSSTLSLKKTPRRKHRTSSGSNSSSPSSAEKERRKRVQREKKDEVVAGSKKASEQAPKSSNNRNLLSPELSGILANLEGPLLSVKRSTEFGTSNRATVIGPKGDELDGDSSKATIATKPQDSRPRSGSGTPSIVSMATNASGATTTSAGSNGSGSTITQASYARREREARKQVLPIDTRASHLKTLVDPPGAEKPDVFSFMEKSDSPSSSISPRFWPQQDVLRRQAKRRTAVVPDTTKDHEVTSDGLNRTYEQSPSAMSSGSSFTSDSGISLKGNESESHDGLSSSESSPKKSNARVAFEPLLRSISQRSASRHHPNSRCATPSRSSSSNAGDATNNKAKLSSSAPMHMTEEDSLKAAHAWYSESAFSTPGNKDMSKGGIKISALSGYDLIASNITSFHASDPATGPPFEPVYRRFEYLNQRLFLHLQDEIAELEDELKLVDEAEAAARAVCCENGGLKPESRRSATKFDVLGRIYMKIGQYNQALISYSKLMRSMNPADEENIQAYRDWMMNVSPIAEPEMAFLDHRKDLMSFSSSYNASPERTIAKLRHSQQSQISSQGLDLLSLCMIIASIAVLVPILAFGVIPGFFGRLFVVIIVGASSTAYLGPSQAIELLGLRYLGCGVGLYLGVMATIACIVR